MSVKIKLKLNEVKQICKNKNIEFLDNIYKGVDYKYNFKCLKHNERFYKSFYNVNKGHLSKCCSAEFNSSKRRFSIEYVKKISLKNGFEFLDNNYINAHVKYNFKCLKHNEIHKAEFNQIKCGHGIRCCFMNYIRNGVGEGGRIKFTKEVINKKCKEKNIELLDSEYNGSSFRHYFKCLKHNEIYKSSINELFYKNRSLK